MRAVVRNQTKRASARPPRQSGPWTRLSAGGPPLVCQCSQPVIMTSADVRYCSHKAATQPVGAPTSTQTSPKQAVTRQEPSKRRSSFIVEVDSARRMAVESRLQEMSPEQIATYCLSRDVRRGRNQLEELVIGLERLQSSVWSLHHRLFRDVVQHASVAKLHSLAVKLWCERAAASERGRTAPKSDGHAADDAEGVPGSVPRDLSLGDHVVDSAFKGEDVTMLQQLCEIAAPQLLSTLVVHQNADGTDERKVVVTPESVATELGIVRAFWRAAHYCCKAHGEKERAAAEEVGKRIYSILAGHNHALRQRWSFSALFSKVCMHVRYNPGDRGEVAFYRFARSDIVSEALRDNMAMTLIKSCRRAGNVEQALVYFEEHRTLSDGVHEAVFLQLLLILREAWEHAKIVKLAGEALDTGYIPAVGILKLIMASAAMPEIQNTKVPLQALKAAKQLPPDFLYRSEYTLECLTALARSGYNAFEHAVHDAMTSNLVKLNKEEIAYMLLVWASNTPNPLRVLKQVVVNCGGICYDDDQDLGYAAQSSADATSDKDTSAEPRQWDVSMRVAGGILTIQARLDSNAFLKYYRAIKEHALDGNQEEGSKQAMTPVEWVCQLAQWALNRRCVLPDADFTFVMEELAQNRNALAAIRPSTDTFVAAEDIRHVVQTLKIEQKVRATGNRSSCLSEVDLADAEPVLGKFLRSKLPVAGSSTQHQKPGRNQGEGQVKPSGVQMARRSVVIPDAARPMLDIDFIQAPSREGGGSSEIGCSEDARNLPQRPLEVWQQARAFKQAAGNAVPYFELVTDVLQEMQQTNNKVVVESRLV